MTLPGVASVKQIPLRSYCTLFDKNYLYQGIALHRSLVRHAGDFRLYALCMDQTAYRVLSIMNVPTLIPVSVDDLMTDEIMRVRQRTTHGQFCWVCQPLICEYVLDRCGVDMVTYLEADSMFFSSPETLFAELSRKSASLVPHNYSDEFDNSRTAGRFCVQFNAFRNDAAARSVLNYWKEWCFKYDKSAPLIYPGQTSLDDWPRKFECVAIIGHLGAGVAPWNIRGYTLGGNEALPTVDEMPVVFYHYHQYGRRKDGGHELGAYPMTRQVVDSFYRPYIRELRLAERAVQAADLGFNYRREYADCATLADVMRSFSRRSVAEYLRTLNRRLRGRYNIYPDSHFG
jgi:hypothetical protein